MTSLWRHKSIMPNLNFNFYCSPNDYLLIIGSIIRLSLTLFELWCFKYASLSLKKRITVYPCVCIYVYPSYPQWHKHPNFANFQCSITFDGFHRFAWNFQVMFIIGTWVYKTNLVTIECWEHYQIWAWKMGFWSESREIYSSTGKRPLTSSLFKLVLGPFGPSNSLRSLTTAALQQRWSPEGPSGPRAPITAAGACQRPDIHVSR